MPLNLYGFVNKTSVSGTIMLANTSQSSVQLLGFQISSPFSQTNNCPANIASGGSCSVTVTFNPTQNGVFNGSVSISNSGPNSPQVAPVIGTAQTVLSVTPTLVDFGQQKLNIKVPGYFSLGNGTAYPTVTVSSVTVQGADFSLPHRTCPLSYPPFTGCSWEVDFTPSQAGLRTGTVTIVANDSPSPHIVNLQGIGASNGLGSLSASRLDFGTQPVGTQSQPQQITLTNTGTGVLRLTSINASQQYSQTNNCGASLAAGASCTISIQFVPTLQGILEGTLSVLDDGLGSPQTIALTGIGQ
jgi:hypothetical protein